MRKQITFLSIALLAVAGVLFLSSYKPQGHSHPFLIMKVVEANRLTGGSKIFIVDEVGTMEEIKLTNSGGASKGDNMSTINYELNKLNELGYDLKHTSMTTDLAGSTIQVYHFQKQ